MVSRKQFETTGLPERCMELQEDPYIAFCAGMNPSPWISVYECREQEREEEDETRNGNGQSPAPSITESEWEHMLQADDEDEAAYRRLVATVQGRA